MKRAKYVPELIFVLSSLRTAESFMAAALIGLSRLLSYSQVC